MILKLTRPTSILRIMSRIMRPGRNLIQKHLRLTMMSFGQKQLHTKNTRGTLSQRVNGTHGNLLAPTTNRGGHIPRRDQYHATDGIGLNGSGGGICARFSRSGTDYHDRHLGLELDPTLRVERVSQIGFLESEICQSRCDGFWSGFFEYCVAASVVGSLSRFEH